MAKYRASFLRREEWWVGWTDDVPGALTQGKTLEEARDNLRDAIRLMKEPVPVEELPDASPSDLIREVLEA
jgi:predicted RNase H-like HicB family nuclease